MLAMAACVAADGHVRAAADTTEPVRANGIKGGARRSSCASRAPTASARAGVDATEALARGERLRIGYQPGEHRYLLSLSIDDRGEVTPLYPERGRQPDACPTARRARRASCPTAWS